jgi:stage V sporulation protein G
VEITEVRIKLMEETSERLQAFCSITFDDSFVIRDLKIIEGTNGPFVAMPSRKLTTHCPQCRSKNHLRAAFCNQCGGRLKEDRTIKDEEGRAKLYADIAHPINSACREMIQERIIREFHGELERAKLPGYVSKYEDFEPEDALQPAARKETAARGERSPERTLAAPTQATPIKPSPAQASPVQSSPVQSSPTQPSPLQPSHVQPAEPQPRGPHKMPAHVPTTNSAPSAGAKQDAFGAGIF